MIQQLSMFDLIGTPEIPFEQQKKGRKGWIIEISAVLLRENGYQADMVCVCTRPVIFRENSWVRDGMKCQGFDTIHGPASGSYGGWRTVYAKRPTWEECQEYARKERRNPGKILYMERDGNFNETWGYENGYQKGA